MTSGDAQFTKLAPQALEELHADAKVLLTTSGTHALELAALLAVVSHYEPLHLSAAQATEQRLPVTEHVAATLVRLPLYAGLSLDDGRQVVSAVIEELEQLL